MQQTTKTFNDPMREFEGAFRADKDSVVIRVPRHPKDALGLKPKMPFTLIVGRDNCSLVVKWDSPTSNGGDSSHGK